MGVSLVNYFVPFVTLEGARASTGLSLLWGIGVRANIHLGVKPSFARMANANCLSRGPPGRKQNNELLQSLFLTVVE